MGSEIKIQIRPYDFIISIIYHTKSNYKPTLKRQTNKWVKDLQMAPGIFLPVSGQRSRLTSQWDVRKMKIKRKLILGKSRNKIRRSHTFLLFPFDNLPEVRQRKSHYPVKLSFYKRATQRKWQKLSFSSKLRKFTDVCFGEPFSISKTSLNNS